MLNRKIAISALSILSAGAIMTGATFAFFSSSATSIGNVFAAGTLNLLLDDGNESTPVASVTASFGNGTPTLAPGGTQTGFVSMHNGGTIDIAEVRLSATQTSTSSPDLADKLNITLARIDSEPTCTTSPTDLAGFTTLAALNDAGLDLPSSAIAVGATRYLCLTFTLDSTTDDTYQGKSITKTFNFVGHQNTGQ